MPPIEIDFLTFLAALAGLGVLTVGASLVVMATQLLNLVNQLNRHLSVDYQKVIVPWEERGSLSLLTQSELPAFPEEATLAEIVAHLSCHLSWQARSEQESQASLGFVDREEPPSSANIRAV